MYQIWSKLIEKWPPKIQMAAMKVSFLTFQHQTAVISRASSRSPCIFFFMLSPKKNSCYLFTAGKRLFHLWSDPNALGQASEDNSSILYQPDENGDVKMLSKRTRASISHNTPTSTSRHIPTSTSHHTPTSTSHHTPTSTSHHTPASTSHETLTSTSRLPPTRVFSPDV